MDTIDRRAIADPDTRAMLETTGWTLLNNARNERNLWANVIARNAAAGQGSSGATVGFWLDYANRVDDARLMLREVAS